MRVATARQLQVYDLALVEAGYTMETLVDMASDLLLPHCIAYDEIIIFCGNGNNGSDGFSLALKLQAMGKQVQVVLVSDSPRRGALNTALLQQVTELHIPMMDVTKMGTIPQESLIVDAMLGFGFVGSPRANTLQAIELVNRTQVTVLSVDIPSGFHCDGFQSDAPMVQADQTVSFVCKKQGFLNQESHTYLGELVVAPLPVVEPELTPPMAILFDEAMAKTTLKPRDYNSYKGKNGHALLCTGAQAYRGAGLLSTKACVYSGCGLSSWCGALELAQTMVANTPELIAIAPEELAEKVEGKTAILIGSGLGLTEDSETLLRFVLIQTRLPLVIDGDGLTLLARNPQWLELARGRAILTPHLGEFRRFVPEEGDLISQAYAFAKTYGVVLVLKGPATIITDGQVIFRATTGNRRMATAGSGDVLAGMVTALLAGAYTPMEAANLAVYLHGAAGDAVAKTHYTAIPSLVIEQIPQVMHQLTI